jgi:hypothetical protein
MLRDCVKQDIIGELYGPNKVIDSVLIFFESSWAVLV